MIPFILTCCAEIGALSLFILAIGLWALVLGGSI